MAQLEVFQDVSVYGELVDPLPKHLDERLAHPNLSPPGPLLTEPQQVR